MRGISGRTRPLCGALAAVAGVFALSGCYSIRSSDGGGQIDMPERPRVREVRAADVALPPGYRIEPVAVSLNMPTAVTFDDAGRIYVVESGYSYGEVFDTPRLVEIIDARRRRVVATGDSPPWTGAVFHDGAFYLAEGGVTKGGRILKITPEGQVTTLVEGLPSFGDHHTNGPVVGPDGKIYFGQGVYTNSGVVGPDNYGFGWLSRHPTLHDIPCRDIKLAGNNFESDNPLTPDEGDEVTTGAYVPFGTATRPGQVIRGGLPCNGAVMRIPTTGGPLELVAWGFRNPYGLAFAPDGRLLVSDNQFDERGSRPVFGVGDYLWAVTPGSPGTWYGWPDYAGGRPVADSRFTPPFGDEPPPLLAEIPNAPPRPIATFGVHSSSNGMDVSRSVKFGHVGQVFVAQFGDMAPPVGKVLDPVGFKVIRVDLATGVEIDFAINRKDAGPASYQGGGGLERPLMARFDPMGDALYIVDFGILAMSSDKAFPKRHTGVLWRVTRERQ